MALISMIPSQTGEGTDPYSSWFGTGEDGDLVVDTDMPLDVAIDEGQIVKQYNSLTITSTGILHPANRCNGLIILVKGDCEISGHLHADKCAPFANSFEPTASQQSHIRLCAQVGGKGGNGGSTSRASGGTATDGRWCGGGWPGGGAGGVAGQNYNLTWTPRATAGGAGTRPITGMSWPVPGASNTNSSGSYGSGGTGAYMTGGVGGASPGGAGGGAYIYLGNDYGAERSGSAGDGYPGGGLWLFVGGTLTITATGIVSADGGNGGDSGTYNTTRVGGGGGGGGGGVVCIVHTGIFSNAGSVHANGGIGGAGDSAGQDGSVGALLIANIADLDAA